MGNFYTEVLRPSAIFHSTLICKDPAMLYPPMRAKVEAMVADAKGNGHMLVIGETFRSQARQEQLFASGKTELRTVGTHGYGLACDLWFLAPDGSVNWQADYYFLAHLAKSHNLVSGYDWGRPDLQHAFRDSDHVQFVDVADQVKLFSGQWYPPDGYIPRYIG